jgi:hypothetical protein
MEPASMAISARRRASYFCSSNTLFATDAAVTAVGHPE